MNTFSFGQGAGQAGDTPAVAAMRQACERASHTFEGALPPGATAGTLEELCTMWECMELLKLQMLLCLAQIHAAGNLLEVGGQRTVAGWMIHTLGTNTAQAHNMALLAELLFHDKLPATLKALAEGKLSVDEAATVAKTCERAVKTRDKTNPDFADADEFRRMIEAGILEAKAQNPAMSAQQMARLGNTLADEYNPSLVEERHQKAFDARRADMVRTFEGSYYFQAWGPDVDAELIDKALAAYTKPHDANKPEVSKAERVYEAFMAIIKTALGHQGCAHAPGPLAMVNIHVPLDVFNGQRKANAQRQARAHGAGQTRDEQAQSQGVRPQGAGHATTQDGQVLAFEALQDLASDSVLRRVITDPASGKPLDVGRGMRNAPEQIRVVANHNRTTCAWEGGCDVRISDTEADHIHSYSRGGATSAENIQPLCSTHNRLKWRRENNPHRQVHRGRKAHRKPDTNQEAGSGSGADPPDPGPGPDPVPRE